MLRVDDNIEIPDDELRVDYARSSGPGGQHVNKVETRVTLYLDLGASKSLSSEQKARIRERLATRISKAGVLRVAAQRHRSRARNEHEARERLAALLRDALSENAPRERTRVPVAERRRRLEDKRRRSRKKELRRSPAED